MPGFLTEDVDDPGRPDPSPPPAQRLQIADADTFVMTFDRPATSDLRRLASELTGNSTPTDKDLEDAVYTALQMVGIAINYDLEVEGKYRRGRKRIFGFWA